MDALGRDSLNETDKDPRIMKSVQGSHTSYNVQQVCDDKNGLVVHAEPVCEGSDVNQFANQIEAAHEVLGSPCETVCADAGYADTEELEKIDAQAHPGPPMSIGEHSTPPMLVGKKATCYLGPPFQLHCLCRLNGFQQIRFS